MGGGVELQQPRIARVRFGGCEHNKTQHDGGGV
jgi:hypothetical protein